MDHTPFEAGLGKYCNLETETGFLGREVLLDKQEPERQLRAVEIDGPAIPLMTEGWPLETAAGDPAGEVSSAAWSPGLETNVSIAMVKGDDWAAGPELRVEAPDGIRVARVRDRVWR